jgi:hypothetical protein
VRLTRQALPVLLIAAGATLGTVSSAAAKSMPPGGRPTVYLGPYSTVEQCMAVRAEVGPNATTYCIYYTSDPNGPDPAGPGYYFQAYE